MVRIRGRSRWSPNGFEAHQRGALVLDLDLGPALLEMCRCSICFDKTLTIYPDFDLSRLIRQ